MSIYSCWIFCVLRTSYNILMRSLIIVYCLFNRYSLLIQLHNTLKYALYTANLSKFKKLMRLRIKLFFTILKIHSHLKTRLKKIMKYVHFIKKVINAQSRIKKQFHIKK